MKRSLAAIAAATLSLSMLAGCSSGSSDSDTIKIGVNYELSGAVATYGDASVKGVEMAFEEINAAGGVNGKQVEMVKYDTKSEPAEATTLATKLMTQDKVLTVIGPATSGSFKASVPVANQNQIPVVSGSATADDALMTDGKVDEYAFRTCFSDSFQGTAMAGFASNELGLKNVVIIQDTSSDYAKGLAENFSTKFTEDGGTVVGEEGYVAGDTDFQAILTRIKSQSFDAIYLPGYYNEVGLIIKQARELGITAPILGGDGYESPTLLQLAGADALNDVYYTNHYSPLDETNTKVAEFNTNFTDKYQAEPDAFAALGYDTAYFVADAIGRATEMNGEAVKDAMASTTDFEGVTGNFSIGEDHNPEKSALVIQLTDGVPSSAVEAG